MADGRPGRLLPRCGPATLFLGAPSAEQTALALHQAVNAKTNPSWPVCGLPEVLYSDHGSDFTSARLEQVCLDTHIRLIHSRVGVPQGRGKIERFYRTLTTELLPHRPGYIPHGTNRAAKVRSLPVSVITAPTTQKFGRADSASWCTDLPAV